MSSLPNDVELYYDLANKEYGIREVRRDVTPDPTGWRNYLDREHEVSIPIPYETLKRILKEAEYFVRERA